MAQPPPPPSIVFVCLHGAAKSVVAAAHLERLAGERGVPLRVAAAGLEPDPEMAPAAVRGLGADGLDVSGRRPRPVTREELAGAWRIVTLGCELGPLAPPGVAVERWDDVPAVSEDYRAARDAIAARLPRLLDEAAAAGGPARPGLWPLTAYFLRLGALGFGGPVALAGFMHRDLVERRRWIDEEEYRLGLTLAQIMPGPLAAQLAIAIGYFQWGLAGATTVGVAFILPSFLMVLALSLAYLAYGGLWWMQALFYGIGAAVIAIIALAAVRLSRSTNRRDPLLWAIFAVLAAVTVWAEAELAEAFILAGLLVLVVRARPRWLTVRPPWLRATALPLLIGAVPGLPALADLTGHVLVQILLFFAKAGAFVFGSGLAIVPFLHQGVVQQFGWLTEQQFLDAVAVAMITPGPVVITVAFIGYLVAGLAGATLAAVGIFLPVYLFTVVPAPWFKRHRDNAQLRAFVQGATAAATGAISGAVIVLARRAIIDLPTAAIALGSLALLWRFRLPEPLLVLAAGALGLALRTLIP